MTDYESIYQDAWDISYKTDAIYKDVYKEAHEAGLAAVVAVAKADAWDEGVEMMCDGAVRDRDYELNPYRKVTP